MNPFDLVLLGYSGLMLAGGLIGFVKAGSRASLIASIVLALPLVVAALDGFGAAASTQVARLWMQVLLALFAWRGWQKRRFMPWGMLALAALIASGLLAGWAVD
jgi:uncharacterized membrane protein (UPF0136 family)